MLSFTLIIPTVGRTAEVDRLFASLARQKDIDFDCLVIDQNEDNRLDPILDRWSAYLRLRRIRATRGVSHARNIGLLQAAGDLIAFPDDDCWYTAGLLSAVAAWFHHHLEFDLLTVGSQDLDGSRSGNRWPQARCAIRPLNAFRTTFCSTIFVRHSVASGPTRFDEAVGPGAGTPWACGDETDYVLNLCRGGARGFFDRRWHIGHAKRDVLSGFIDSHRAEGYGCGMGYVMSKHSLHLLGAAFVVYDLLRSLLVGLRGDRKGMALCLRHARGLITGLAAHAVTEPV